LKFGTQLLYGDCRTGAQIILPKSGRSLAYGHFNEWERDAWQTLFSLGAHV